MNDPLSTYLADHLAGAMHAIETLKNLHEKRDRDPLGQFGADLLREIEADREVLERIADRVGGTSGAKEFTAWVAEKLSRLKLRHESGDGLGTFETLEFLLLGIHGKWALWRSLAAISPMDTRLQGPDYERLTARAQAQHDELDAHRLDVARMTFRPVAK